MSGNILRAFLIVLLSFFVAEFIWLEFLMLETDKTIDKAQVNLAINDVKIIRQSLEVLRYTYNLDKEEGKMYTTTKYHVFKKKIEKIWDRHGGMPLVLPSGQNFAGFSYSGNGGDYHITVRAKDKNGTVVHGTFERVWH